MKALTIKQPWASLICEGIKDIENRSWRTKFRGRVLIHASATPIKGLPCEALTDLQYAQVFNQNKLDLLVGQSGAIIGSVEIVDCLNHTYDSIRDTKSIWAEKGSWHWVLANPILFPDPIPAKGKLSFWDYPKILSEPEEKNGESFCHCQLPVKEENQVMSMGDHYRCRYCGGRWYK